MPRQPRRSIAGLNDSATIGLLTPNGDGTVTYDPSGRFDVLRDGDVAVDTFEYTIDDGMGGTDAATVTVEVTGVDDAPVAAARRGVHVRGRTGHHRASR